MGIGGRWVEPVLLRIARRVFDLEIVNQVDLLIQGALVRVGRALSAHASAVDNPSTLSSCGNAVRIALLRRRVDGTRNSHIHRRCTRGADADGFRRDVVIRLDEDDGGDDVLLQLLAILHLVGHRPYKRAVVKRHALDVVDPRTEAVLPARRSVVERGLRTKLGEDFLIQGAVLSGLDTAQRLVAFLEVRADGAVANLARLDKRAGIGRGYRSGGGNIDVSRAIGGGIEGNGARGARSARGRRALHRHRSGAANGNGAPARIASDDIDILRGIVRAASRIDGLDGRPVHVEGTGINEDADVGVGVFRRMARRFRRRADFHAQTSFFLGAVHDGKRARPRESHRCKAFRRAHRQAMAGKINLQIVLRDGLGPVHHGVGDEGKRRAGCGLRKRLGGRRVFDARRLVADDGLVGPRK